MNVLGVDLSTKAITAVLLDHEENLQGWWHEEMPGEKAVDRMFYAHHAARRIPWSDAAIIAFERPAGRGTQAVMDCWRVAGACWFFIPPAKEVWEFTPSDWKKRVGLPGNASKDDIALFVEGYRADVPLLGAQGERINAPQDFYDAYCVALCAVRENAKGIE